MDSRNIFDVNKTHQDVTTVEHAAVFKTNKHVYRCSTLNVQVMRKN